MLVAWYLKLVSSSAWNTLDSFRNFYFFSSFFTFVSSFVHHPCPGLTSHLYLKLTPGCYSTTPKPWCFVFCWLFGDKGKMAPTIGMCGQRMSKDGEDLEERPKRPANNINQNCGRKNFVPLVIAMVGLPARRKTVVATKLSRYLNWIGEVAEVFTVSNYRRKLMEQYDNHNLFRADNKEAMEIRIKSAQMAINDATAYLKGSGNIAILDGTFAAHSQRHKVHDHFVNQLGYKVLFVECVCDDDDILSRNIKDVLQNSPDYKDMNAEKALDDFNHKIQHYLEQYEPVSPKQERFNVVKIINDGESVTTHRVSGHLESKVLSYLSSFRSGPKTLYFSRHGESEYNVLGRIGGDTNLSPRGRKYAASLASNINKANIRGLKVWTSELQRTKQTALGINAPVEHLAPLNELDAV